jgi:hypothetical protein
MRQRLIEMIKEHIRSLHLCDSATYFFEGGVKSLADHLLANGVIVCDTCVIKMENRPLVTQCLGRPLDEIIELVKAKDEGRIVVPPCKVGQTVYMITPNGNIRNLTILSIDIELEEKEITMACLAVYEFEGNPCYLQIHSFKFCKTVFLTREEAEKALKEAKG